MTIDDLLDRLDRVAPRPSGGWQARCPAHDDRDPSLSIDLADGTILLHCFAGCSVAAITDALGLDLADLFVEPLPITTTVNGLAQTTWYDVRDTSGVVRARHKRVDHHGKKSMSWWLPDATEPGLNGLKSEMLPLFGMDMLGRWPHDDSILLVEGEKAAHALLLAGIPALGTVTGAAGCPATETLIPLAGRSIILWPDHDEPGRRHMERLGNRLQGAGVTDLRWFTWTEAPGGGDAADYLATRPSRQLRADLAQAYRLPTEPPSEFILSALLRKGVAAERIGLVWETARAMANRTPEEIDWLVYPWVAVGTITELDASMKAGKTTLILAMCRAILDGRPFLDGQTRATPIVYLTEQHDRTFTEALRRANLLDCDEMHVLRYINTLGHPWPAVVADAVIEAQARGAGLLIIDTLSQFAGMRGDMENSAGAALEAMEPVQIAAETGLGVIIVRHERKSGGEVGHSARGSSAFGGVVDVVVQLRRPEGNARPTIRVLTALSRFDETPDTLAIELLDTGDYTVLGDAADVALSEATAALLAAAPEQEPGATLNDLLKASVTTHRTIAQQALAALVKDGRLNKTGAGKKGDPYRFARAGEAARQTDIHSAGTSFLNKAERKHFPEAAACERCGQPTTLTAADGRRLCVVCLTRPPEA